MNNNLIVAETFYSIQGEGHTMGVPAVFLRLGGCNLLCKSDNWVCDSIEVWQKGVKTDFNDVLTDEYVDRLRNGAHLVLTGGEPMLHQKKIVEYIKWFEVEFNFKPIIEIETNGTITPKDGFENYIDYWNCSPKLSNSGESYLRRFNDVALHFINRLPNSMFKFVISKENDVLEVINEFSFLLGNKIWFMPSGENQKQLDESRLMVVENCIKLGVHYSERLHIVIWNKKTGV
tara:strand:+ start:879 stop:1574 length:696 start_codon:yes stop_codon:yes gene_type:complete